MKNDFILNSLFQINTINILYILFLGTSECILNDLNIFWQWLPPFNSKHDTLQKVYFCGRKTCPNSSILCHWRCTASFSYLHLYIPFCMKSNFFCNFTPCISVNVMFLVQHFAFVVKTKSLFVRLIFLPLE